MTTMTCRYPRCGRAPDHARHTCMSSPDHDHRPALQCHRFEPRS